MVTWDKQRLHMHTRSILLRDLAHIHSQLVLIKMISIGMCPARNFIPKLFSHSTSLATMPRKRFSHYLLHKIII